MNPKIETFEKIAKKLDCNPTLPEKENFLIQVIKHFNEDITFDEGSLVLGGGTSLARAHKVLKRFSEDADFKFVPFGNLTSTKKVRDKLTDFVKTLKGFELIEEPKNDSTKIRFKLNYDKHPDFTKSIALRSYLQIEMFFSDTLNYPVKRLPISSLYNEFENLPPETELDCVSLEETAIDKLSSLLWRTNHEKNPDPANIRHLHDLAILSEKLIVDDMFKQTLAKVYSRDMEKRAKTSKNLQQSLTDTISALSNEKRYKDEYIRYVFEMSYAPDLERLSYEQLNNSFAGHQKKKTRKIFLPQRYWSLRAIRGTGRGRQIFFLRIYGLVIFNFTIL